MAPGRRWLSVNVTRIENDSILSLSDKLQKALGKLDVLKDRYAGMENTKETKKEAGSPGEFKQACDMLIKKLRQDGELECNDELNKVNPESAVLLTENNDTKQPLDLRRGSGKDGILPRRRTKFLTGTPIKRSESMVLQGSNTPPQPVQVLEFPDYPRQSESFSQTDHPDEISPNQQLQTNTTNGETLVQEEPMDMNFAPNPTFESLSSSPTRATGAESPLGADYMDAVLDWAKQEVFGLATGHAARQYQRRTSSEPVPSRTSSPVTGIFEDLNSSFGWEKNGSMSPKNLVIDETTNDDLEEGEIVDDDDTPLEMETNDALEDRSQGPVGNVPQDDGNESGVQAASVEVHRNTIPEFGTPLAIAEKKRRHTSGGYIKQSKPKKAPIEDDGREGNMFFKDPDRTRKRKHKEEKKSLEEDKKVKNHDRPRDWVDVDKRRKVYGQPKKPKQMETARSNARWVSMNHKQKPSRGGPNYM